MDIPIRTSAKLRDLIVQKQNQAEKLTVTPDYGVHNSHNRGNTLCENRIDEWDKKGVIQVSDTKATLMEFYRLDPSKQKDLYDTLEPKVKRYPKATPKRPALFNAVCFNEAMFNDPGTQRNGENIDTIQDKFKKIMFPDFDKMGAVARRNAAYDVLHLACHYLLFRDVFLTNNLRHFQNVTKRYPAMIITDPEDFVKIGEEYFESGY